MRPARRAAGALLLCAGLLIPAQPASAVAKPAWQLSATALPSNFAPGAHGNSLSGPAYLILATNIGGGATTSTTTVTATLPVGLTAIAVSGGCEVIVQTVKCERPAPVNPGQNIEVRVVLDISASPPQNPLTTAVKVEGGGALDSEVEVSTPVGTTAVPFDFLPGFATPLTEEDGELATLAGSHPYQATMDLGFPTEKPGISIGAAGHLRDAWIDFPPGQVVDPTATEALCTEKELTFELGPESCPPGSILGTITVVTRAIGLEAHAPTPLYNMVPPPGVPAEVAFDALEVGVFVHIVGEVRSDSDYGITATTPDILGLTFHPVFGARAQLWGDPTAPVHDEARGATATAGATALLTLPTHCDGEPLGTSARADSWEQPTPPFAPKRADYEGATLEGCNQLEFKPSIEAKPTTGLIDSPAGLDFTLRQPQETSKAGRYPAPLRNGTFTFPQGLLVNPSSAAGQEACSPTQIGLITAVGDPGAHFSKAPPSCPDASKLGTVQVITPLLAQTKEVAGGGVVVARDPQGHPIPRPLPGSVYLAQPFQNPFGSLIAIYITVEDPRSGTYAKLAGQVRTDPLTGQVTTEVTESPQLPIEAVRLHVFEGPRAPLRTPPACGTYSTSTELTPWSAPEGKGAQPSSSFATTAAPGGACPASADQAANSPRLKAGTLSLTAGAYSPLVARLSREDGSQPLARFEVTLPPGLTARLAGVPYCTEAQIAAAIAREHPNQGAAEQADPSCPAASQIGVLDAAAGAGPTPLHTPGRLYLAGPYEGAPLSAVAITPALAGPFDLGAVVIRSPLYIDPVSAQGRAVSDPLPQILDGIPLDLRAATIRIDRPSFTRNPTSCDPLAFSGTATSAFGQVASLSERFQVGACRALAFKPKLGLRLFGPTNRGAHPRLRAVLSAKPGEAGIARSAVTLPHSEFIDQGHFRTICTRVQFAAHACPAGSVYGHAVATSPLLDYPLEGPVYLRSSDHKLPDVVVALRGPERQPVEVDLDGRVDSVRGGLRASFESVPDQPVSKFVLTMRGGQKGLFQNSTNLCRGAHRATVLMDGQNGKTHDTRPQLRAQCPATRKHKHKHKGQRR